MSALTTSIVRLKGWFIDAAMPLWAAQGYDHERGGFYESLDFNGKPISGQPRRVRVQARQIHTFSQVGIRGWRQGAEPLAAKGFDFFLHCACPDNGARGCVHEIDDNANILDDRRDLYDQAFLLLACASRWQAARDQRALDLAANTLAFLDAELASPHGGWREDDRGTLPRRQNPHMHLFEAFMALYDATGDSAYLKRAENIFALFNRAFYDPAAGVLREFYDEKLSILSDDAAIEPGHMFEWCWLLRNFERFNNADTSIIRAKLFQRAAELGQDAAFYGFVSNEVDIKTREIPGNKRLWPQTEYLKALIIAAQDGDHQAMRRAADLIDSLFHTYLKTAIAGLWVDEFNGDGAPRATDVPASILYHLFEAVAETAGCVKTMEAP